MDWLQTLSIIATVLISAYYIHRDIREEMKTQTARTDKLYEMYCEIQKENAQKWADLLQKFYEKK
jgi:hypothetical protein